MPAARIVSAAVQRADSLRSERSDASQANKRVSFNRDVDVKHINHPQQPHQQQQQQQYIPRIKGPAPAPPVGSHNVDRHDINIAANSASASSANHAVPPFYNVYKEPTLLSEAELAQEAERIIQQVDQISCTVASPNPHLLANYETRSLERRNLAASKRNNQLQGDNGANWSRTLPTASTKNQLLGEGKASSGKKTKNVEQKNNILHQQQQQQQQQQQFEKLDPIIESVSGPRRPQQLSLGMMTILDQQEQYQRNGKAHQNNRDTAPTTPPKYDSGIEMEATSRPNVNLIVQQLTEESRQRELIRRQYQDELNLAEDPLAPRLPTLNLIEPDPQFGLSHNKNLPFSYTGGVSPTRTSPLRSPLGGSRFTSPPPPRPELPPGKIGGVTDVVYAQVKTSAQHQGRGQSQSPERNVYRSSNGAGADKVPAGRGKLFQFQEQQQQVQQQKQTEVIRQHLGYQKGVGIEQDEEEEPEGPVDEEDLDAIKAKARFLFGDDGQGQQTERKLSGGSGNSRILDARNNNRNNVNNSHVQHNNNNNNAAGGLQFKYSTLLKGQQQNESNNQQMHEDHHADRSYHHTTKILIAGNEQQQQQQQQRKQPRQSDQRVFQYSDDEDGHRFGGRGGIKVYQDRSVSPEPRIQPLTNRIRSLQMQQQQQQPSSRKSPERSYHQREVESRTLPLPQKANQMSMTSTRLIQDAERGRTVVRQRTEPIIHSSRLTQFQSRYEDEMDGEEEYIPVAPKPPLRIKKLSRERMEASPPRTTTVGPAATQTKVAFNTVPWRRDDRSPETSPERNYPLNRPANSKKMQSPYRYQPPLRSSLTPSPERRISDSRRWNEPAAHKAIPPQQNNKVNHEPEKQEKIRRQRSKFLSVFLGSKANKSEKKAAKAEKQQVSSSSVLSSPVAPAAIIKSGPAVKEVRGQAPPQVAKWSADDEAELVRQSRSLLVKGQSHQSNQTATTTANNNNNNNNHKSSSSNRLVPIQEPAFIRKTAAPQPPVAVGDPSALRYRVVTTSNGTSKDAGHRRRSSTDRTDTSESDSHVNNHQRNQFKNLRQKSQSFNNLNYRPDPAIVLGEEHQHQNRSGRHNQETSVQFQSDRRYPEDGGRYKPQQRGIMSDARPYASTNLIHQIGAEAAELRDRNGTDEQRRGPPLVTSGPTESAPPPPAPTAAAQSHRQMRYFGDTDLESQPSRGGGYSSRYMPKAKVLRSASSAAGMGAVRRGVLHQRGRHHPVSSVNSSESDGSAMQSAAGSAESQRSVYLHATTVADIPVTSHGRTPQQQLQASRRHKAQSREDMSALSGTTGSTLRRTQTRQISRSYSVLAPWKPRHYRDKYEITYSNQQQPGGQSAPAIVVGDVGKPPRAPVRRREDVIAESEDSAEGYRPPTTVNPAVGQRQTGQTSSSKTDGASVSRSSTMPKNSKLMAGWFRKKKR